MNRENMSRTELAKIRLYREFDERVKELKEIAAKKNINLSKYIITKSE